MNKENLLEDIEALEPMQQEKVARYVASLKKKKKNNTNTLRNGVDWPEFYSDEGYEFRNSIDKYALKYETMLELRELFADAPSAEELCAMLTK